jgi:hypothetical protein
MHFGTDGHLWVGLLGIGISRDREPPSDFILKLNTRPSQHFQQIRHSA